MQPQEEKLREEGGLGHGAFPSQMRCRGLRCHRYLGYLGNLTYLTAVQLLEEKLAEEAAWPEQERLLFKLDAIAMWTKLRPGVRALLAQLAPLFQLWIFTNGTRYMHMHMGMHCQWPKLAARPAMTTDPLAEPRGPQPSC